MVKKNPKTRNKGKIQTSVLINPEDWNWLVDTGYKPTSLLRVKIQEMKKQTEQEKVIENLSQFKTKCISFLRKNNLMEKFMNFKQNGTD